MSSSQSPRLSRLARLFQLARLLREQPRSVRELAAQLYVTPGQDDAWTATERIVQRDLEALRDLEPTFEQVPGRPPRYVIRTQRTALEPTETVTLLAAAQVVLDGHPGQHQVLREAAQTLRHWSPQPLVVPDPEVPVRRRRRTRETAHLEQIVQAWTTGRPLQTTLPGRGERGVAETVTLRPLRVELCPQTLGLQLVAQELCPSFGPRPGQRTYVLSELKTLRCLAEPPARTEPAAPGEAGTPLHGHTMQLRVQVHPDAVPALLECSSVQVGELVRGQDDLLTTTLTLPLTPTAPRRVCRWLTSLPVTVLGPPQWQAEWRRELVELSPW